METRTRTTVPATLLVAVLAAACGSSTGPGSGAGTVALRYEGDMEGTLEVRSGPPDFSVEGVPAFADWSLAARRPDEGGLVLAAFRIAEDGRGDLFVLELATAGTGSFSCGPPGPCDGRLLFGIPDHGGLPNQPAATHYEIVSGQVVLTAVSADRVAGSVSLVARSGGGEGTETLSVQDGSFRLSRGRPAAAASVLCMAGRAAGTDC